MKEFFSKSLLLYNFATWALLFLSIILLAYIIERSLFLHRGKVAPQQFLNGIMSLLKNHRYNEALVVCESSPGVVPLLVKTVITFREKPHSEMIHSVSAVALLEIPLLERRINSIKLIAKIAPIISFIGCIQMLAKVLDVIKSTSSYFSASAALVFLQQAMVLIAFAFTINILGTLAYSFLYGRIRRLVHDMEWICNEIIKFVSSERN